jgi:hypothetical protein
VSRFFHSGAVSALERQLRPVGNERVQLGLVQQWPLQQSLRHALDRWPVLRNEGVRLRLHTFQQFERLCTLSGLRVPTTRPGALSTGAHPSSSTTIQPVALGAFWRSSAQ